MNEESNKRRNTAERASIITGIERAIAEVDIIKEEDDESREMSVFSNEGFAIKKPVGRETAPTKTAHHDIEAPPVRQP